MHNCPNNIVIRNWRNHVDYEYFIVLYNKLVITFLTDTFCIAFEYENAESTGFVAPLSSTSENSGAIEVIYLHSYTTRLSLSYTTLYLYIKTFIVLYSKAIIVLHTKF